MSHFTSNPSIPQLQIHGHRGCRGLFPENTIPAFLHALQLGVDVLEMDVVISADHQVVVSHEPWLSARLGLSPTGQNIDPQFERAYNLYRLPYATIRQSNLGMLSHPSFPGQQQVPSYRPLLHEVLCTIEAVSNPLGNSSTRYAIELKSISLTDELFHPTPDVFVELVVQAIPPTIFSRVTLLSFDTRILQVLHKRWPSLHLSMLVETPFTPATLFAELGFIPEVFGPDFFLLTPDLLRQLRFLYPLLVIVPWTINQPEDLVQAMDWHVDGITTDYPDRLISLLNKV